MPPAQPQPQDSEHLASAVQAQSTPHVHDDEHWQLSPTADASTAPGAESAQRHSRMDWLDMTVSCWMGIDTAPL